MKTLKTAIIEAEPFKYKGVKVGIVLDDNNCIYQLRTSDNSVTTFTYKEEVKDYIDMLDQGTDRHKLIKLNQ